MAVSRLVSSKSMKNLTHLLWQNLPLEQLLVMYFYSPTMRKPRENICLSLTLNLPKNIVQSNYKFSLLSGNLESIQRVIFRILLHPTNNFLDSVIHRKEVISRTAFFTAIDAVSTHLYTSLAFGVVRTSF
jgi:hypothetical protein